MNNNQITVLILYQAKSGMEEQAKQELTSLISSVVSEEACIGIKLHQDPNDSTRFMLYENWADKDFYLGEHMQTPYIQSFIQKAGDFLVAPPEISFWTQLN
jgi:quinol monooxygenase YgiN